MQTLRRLVANCNDFERSFLASPGAILDVQLSKLMCVFLGLALARVSPDLMQLPVSWFLLGAAACAVLSFLHAVSVFRSARRDCA